MRLSLEQLEERTLLALFAVANLNDSGAGSLRQAILDANSSSGGDIIGFTVAGTVNVLSQLPELSDSTGGTTIDGSTAPGFAGSPVLVLNGPGTGTLARGLRITTANNEVRALQFQAFTVGIEITGTSASGNALIGNYIGTDGIVARPNRTGVSIDSSSNNRIGTNGDGANDAAERNVVSGNIQEAIVIRGSLATGNVVAGNFVGTNAAGISLIRNGQGVAIDSASGNTVGGTAAALRNVVSGNSNGVAMFGTAATANVVQGNFIGTDVTGTVALGNSYGVFSSVKNNTIGGTVAGAGNLISGNTVAGVYLYEINASGNQVLGNLIGTNPTGTGAIGNQTGVWIENAPGNSIGGSVPGARNVISGNGGGFINPGIIIQRSGAAGNAVQGNFIGTDISGTTSIGGSQIGVSIDGAPNNLIGGTTSAARNIISGNSSVGVSIGDNTGSGNGTGNLVQGNYIGVDVSGTVALGNAGGVSLARPNNTVGGSEVGAGNVISGNQTSGISIGFNANGTVVAGNFIGTNATGTAALANLGSGVIVLSSNNRIGTDGDGVADARERNIISANRGSGISISSGSGNVVAGNYIGLDVAGTGALGNGVLNGSERDGISVSGSNNRIGTNGDGVADDLERNTISGNANNGITISSNNNVVAGNFIGTNANGTAALGNLIHGIFISATGNRIGVSSASVNPAAERNVISGNLVDGIFSSSSGTIIAGNLIGTDSAGASAVPNIRYGVELSSSTNVRVGTNADGIVDAFERNVISGNQSNGIVVTSGTGCVIAGNYIGIDVTGTQDLGNAGAGVQIAANARVGTNGDGVNDAAEQNVISGNDNDGVQILGSGALVAGNRIGTDASGTANLGNTGSGVAVMSGGNNNSITANTIAFNSKDGVLVFGTSSTRNKISQNSIFLNSKLGINLANFSTTDGVTANDASDSDTGANNLQNFPLITSATSSNGATTIAGSLNSVANSTYAIEFFATTLADPSGFGEGQRYLGATTVTTNGTGNASVSVTLGAATGVDEYITATAIDSTNNTSEFSANTVRVRLPNRPPDAVDDAPTTPEDTTVTISVLANDSDPDGDTLTVTAVTQPTHGTVVINANNTVTYTLAVDFNGSDFFAYTISDSFGGTDTATVTVTVTPVNDPPVAGPLLLTSLLSSDLAINTSSSRSEQAPVAFDGTRYLVVFVKNDDIYGRFVDRTGVAAPDFAIATKTGVQKEISLAFNGSYYFVTYTDNWASQLLGRVISTTGQLLGTELQLSTQQQGQYFSDVASDGSGFLVVFGDQRSFSTNNGDIFGQRVSVSSAGVATLSSGNLQISPSAGHQFNPSVAFGGGNYFVTWTQDPILNSGQFDVYGSLVSPGGTVSASVAISTAASFQGTSSAGISFDGTSFLVVFDDERRGVPDVSGARISQAGVLLDGPAATGGIAISTNAGFGAPHRPQVVFNGSDWLVVWSGTLTKGARVSSAGAILDANGVTLTKSTTTTQFFPEVSFDGTNYLVTWSQSSTTTKAAQLVGLTPTDQAFTINEDATVAVPFVATDVDGDPLTYSIVTPPAQGTLSGTAPNVTYNPAPNYFGADAFTYKANDGQLDSNVVTVRITINSVNDAPTNTVPGTQATNEDTALVISSGNGNQVSIADVDAGTAAMRVTLSSTNGTLTLSGTAGLTFVTGGNGSSAMTFTGTTSNVNAALIGATFNPTPNFNGAASLSISTSDQGNTGAGGPLTDTDMIAITVNPINDSPVATSQSITTNEDTSKSIILTGDDGDSEVVQTLTFAIATGPAHGTLSGFDPATGAVTYTPAINYNGPDSFTFTVTDDSTAGPPPGLVSAPAMGTITINAVNDAPVANDQSVATNEDAVLEISLSGSDVDNTSVTFSIVMGPSHGILSVISGTACTTVPNATGTPGSNCTASVSYTPTLDYNGPDAFTFRVNDGNLNSSTATVSMNTTPVNDQPAAHVQANMTDEDTAIVLALAGEDGDPEVDESITFAIASNPAHGVLSDFNPATGAVTYTPAVNYYGPDTFTFTVTDDGTAGLPSGLTSAPAAVTITVNAVNDAPVVAAVAASVTVNEGTTAGNTGSWSDSDAADTVTLTASVGTVIKSGTNAAGSWSWSFNTSDGPAESQLVTITANDGNGGVSSVSFSLIVNNVPPSVADPSVAPTSAVELSATSFEFSANFTDPANGADAPFTCTINWGDGTSDSGIVTGTPPNNCSFTGTHTYPAAGTYSVTVSVTDKDNGAGRSSAVPVTVGCTTIVSTTNDSGPGSLRNAIECANSRPGTDTISFNVPGFGPHTIQPFTALPAITDPVVIDGFTQPGASENSNSAGMGLNSVLMIELDGSLSGGSGLRIDSGASTIRGLVIHSFASERLLLNGASGNVVEGNFIGTDVTCTISLGGQAYGVHVFGSSNNTIGGTTSGARNVISGGNDFGILIDALYTPPSSGNLVQGNFIGTDMTGTVALGNAGVGIVLNIDAPNNTIGGNTSEARNIISASRGIREPFALNGGPGGGIQINSYSPGNVVQGNYIGTDVTGTHALGNGQNGVGVGFSDNITIGGTTAGTGNLISGNIGYGISLAIANATLIQGNFLGTDATGTMALGNNRGVFVYFSPNTTIGGTTVGARNLISGNTAGIDLRDSDTLVQGNFIGTDVTGTTAVGNGVGVLMADRASDNTIGGTSIGAGNLISGNGHGILISGILVNSNIVQGNLIGTDVTGTAALGNADRGVLVYSDRNTIGGATAGGRNVISGNAVGVDLEDSDNLVQGNFIGTDVSGSARLPNRQDGVLIASGMGNTIGGVAPGSGNVISGNEIMGVRVLTTQNVVQGNRIGTDVTGTIDLGNQGEGVRIENAGGNTIGGTVPGAGNLISGNNGYGVRVNGPDSIGNLLEANLIGVDVTATSAIRNDGGGVIVGNGASFNSIGGSTVGARNILSGNAGYGVYIGEGEGNAIQGNLIGTAADETSALGNGLSGVWIEQASNNSVGGSTSAFGNLIAFNRNAGVVIRSGMGNPIRMNSIRLNGELGIDLSGNGVTPNDSGDSDTGPNTLQNFPVITHSQPGSTTRVAGTLNSLPNTTFALDFYANGGADPSGNGEGERYLGSLSVSTDASGNASFDTSLLAATLAGEFVTATATDPDGNTSEFSGAVIANLPPDAVVDVYDVDEDATLAGSSVLANDSDLHGGLPTENNSPLTAVLVAGPGHAAVFGFNADGTFSYTPTADFNGDDSFTYQAADSRGALSGVTSVVIHVRSINDAPVVSNDSFGVDEDSSLSDSVLTNDSDSHSGAPSENNTPLTVVLVAGPTNAATFSLNGDGTFSYTPAANFNGPDGFTYRVVDSLDATSLVATVAITVNSVNDAPVAVADSFVMDEGTTLVGASVLGNDSDFHAGAPGENNTPLTAQLVTGPANAGAFVLNSDGTFSFTPVAGFSGMVTFTYRAVDSLRAASEPAVVSIEVRATGAVTIGPDPCDVTKTALIVRGTAAADHILITPSGNSGAVQVSLNGVSQGVFSPTGRIVVRAGDGDDNIQIAGSISLATWAYGEGGNDRIKGGAGYDVLLGGAGDDLLVGGSGRDLLVGGWGADRMVGDAHDDILIAGATDFDANEAAICDIMDEWSSGRDYGVRVQNLINGGGSGDRLNGSTFLSDQTVHDDGVADILTGSSGQDWFLFNQDGDNAAAKDKITDLHAQEFANDIDFINGP